VLHHVRRRSRTKKPRRSGAKSQGPEVEATGPITEGTPRRAYRTRKITFLRLTVRFRFCDGGFRKEKAPQGGDARQRRLHRGFCQRLAARPIIGAVVHIRNLSTASSLHRARSSSRNVFPTATLTPRSAPQGVRAAPRLILPGCGLRRAASRRRLSIRLVGLVMADDAACCST
jgi:hypothetical protein